ncbi:MAG: hypothetical protein ACOWWR_18385 [Eubacteriales bacterium]
MHKCKIQFILNKFIVELTDCSNIYRTSKCSYTRVGNGFQQIPVKQTRTIIELAFLQTMLAWEVFLEDSFIRYICGAETQSGYSPKCYLKPISMEHSFDMLRQDKPYIEWNNASNVLKLAKLYFKDGQPYRDALSPILQDLNRTRIIRNSIAHSSKASRKSLENLARDILGHKPNKLTPGLLLSLEYPNANNSIFEYYIDILRLASQRVIL